MVRQAQFEQLIERCNASSARKPVRSLESFAAQEQLRATVEHSANDAIDASCIITCIKMQRRIE
jgi:hypothetical protein